jgi:hypothetical protein
LLKKLNQTITFLNLILKTKSNMAVKKVATGWQADFRPQGLYGKRIRKTFPTKREAETFEITESAKARTTPDYQAPVKDNRTLSDIAQAWFDYSGHELASGKKRLLALKCTAKNLGDPIARHADPRDFLNYRRQRVADGVSENHLNHELVYLKTMFNGGAGRNRTGVRGVAVRCMTTLPPRRKNLGQDSLQTEAEKILERETGFEPATSTLARLRSTN